MNIKKHALLLCIIVQTNLSYAGEILTNNSTRLRSSNIPMTEYVYNRFVKIQQMIQEKKFDQSRKALATLSKKHLNKFEKANIYQFLGMIDSLENKYLDAANHYKKAIESNILTNQAHFNLMLKRAAMLIELGDYQNGIESLHSYYNATDRIQDYTYAMEANAYYQLKDYDKAIKQIKKAIEISEVPNEKWIYSLYMMYKESSQPEKALKTLKTLRKINPKNESYWERS